MQDLEKLHQEILRNKQKIDSLKKYSKMNRIETLFGIGKFFTEKSLLLIFGFFILSGFTPAILWLITGDDFGELTFLPFILTGVLLLSWFPIHRFLNWKLEKIRNKYKELISVIHTQREKLFLDYKNVGNIPEILEYSKNLYSYVSNIKEYKDTSEQTLDPKAKKYLNEYFQKVISFTVIILKDICSDLELRLMEQKKSLESANDEVKINIQGTTELSQVSELQKARLDRQIEQFEELQRVLVKV